MNDILQSKMPASEAARKNENTKMKIEIFSKWKWKDALAIIQEPKWKEEK